MPLDKTKTLKIFPDHLKWLGEFFSQGLKAGLAAEEIPPALPGLELLEVPKSASVVREGERDADFFIIYKGEVSINKVRPFLGPIEVVRLREGDHFGEIALLGSKERTATVATETPTLIFRLPAAQMRALLDKKPALAERLRAVAAARLKKLGEVLG